MTYNKTELFIIIDTLHGGDYFGDKVYTDFNEAQRVADEFKKTLYNPGFIKVVDIDEFAEQHRTFGSEAAEWD